MNLQINWQAFKFSELTGEFLYKILQLRQQVFILEQKCFYLDIDDQDKEAVHLVAISKEQNILAYCRIFIQPRNAKIGRVLVAYSARSLGLGKQLMQKAIDCVKDKSVETVCIEAQSYLLKFYKQLGFEQTSEEYDLDGITHIKMELKIN